MPDQALIAGAQSVLRPPPFDVLGLNNRRQFMTKALGCLAGASSLGAFSVTPAWGSESIQAPVNFWSAPRWVWLKRASTGEEIKTYYWADGKLDEKAYQKISWFLRDRRFETMIQTRSSVLDRAVRQGEINGAQMTPWALMNPIVIDILYAHCAWLNFYGYARALDVTSGFRHFFTNSMTEGAVRDSLHTKASATDFFIQGVPVEQVARFGIWLAGGGVGLYRSKNFIHVDPGRVRSWVKN